jgi:pro-kumamolisin-like protein/subtilase family protein
MTCRYYCRYADVSRMGVLVSLLFVAALSHAQVVPENRIRTAISDSDAKQVQGNVHPLARPEFDRGKIADSTLLPRVTIFFKPSPSQQGALSRLLSEQQDRSSPNYHRWITPQEFGASFGLSQNDLAQVTSWLESRGFVVHDIPASRNAVSFSGSAAQVAAAFGTSIHRYSRDAEEHYANLTEPSIPAALAGVISGLAGLNDFRPQPRIIRGNLAGAKPDFTDGTTFHFLAPADFSLIYDVQPLYNRGISGTGQKIAIVGQTDIQISDIREFRILMTLPASDPQVVRVPGSADPGMLDGDLQEADLDLEWAGAIAKNATLIYVNAKSAWDSLQYAITSDLAPVISVSYSACEAQFSPTDVQSFMLLGQQANAQGQTIVAASGDSGAAGCDPLFATQATKGLAVSIPASMPYVTAVGGTEFNEGSGTYWNTTNNGNNGSVLSYIPEMSWDESTVGLGIEATGGGASTLFTKPSWQSGLGVPNDGVRDVPDVSFSASADHDGYVLCDETYNASIKAFTPACPNGPFGGFDVMGGTSAGTPALAGIVALLNQAMNSPQGNINAVLYRLASLSASPLHDITGGSNVVPCQTNPPSPGCPTSGSGAGTMGYSAGPGYDMATGLGSLDANALVSAWSSIVLPPDFDISVSPANITLRRGSTSSAHIAVSHVGGLTGAPSLSCNIPAIFLDVTCSIASAGPNIFTLTLASSNSTSELPAANTQTGARLAERFGKPGAQPPSARIFAYENDGRSYPLAAWLLFGSMAIFWCTCRPASGRAKLASLVGVVCVAAALLGCAGGTYGGLQNAQNAIQLTPQSVALGQNDQQQFTALLPNSTNGSFTWTVSPSVGSSNVVSSNSAVAVYTAPSVISSSQTVTVTATSVADPTKQASARIELLPPEAGAIQVTGSLNGMSHTVGISLSVN